MKTIVLLGALLSVNFAIAQNRIEILVNDEVQKVSADPIHVISSDDKIEIRVYYSDPKTAKNLVDSVKTIGCGVRIKVKNKFRLGPPPQQQVQQKIETKTTEKRYEIVGSLKPVQQKGYVSFAGLVNEITGCQGKNFYLQLMSNNQAITKYPGYSKKYTFYFVL